MTKRLPRAAPPAWTDAQLLALYRGWPDLNRIAEATGRTQDAILWMARREGIKGRPKGYRAWTGAEVKRLLRLDGEQTPREEMLKQFPGRTMPQIDAKLYELRLEEFERKPPQLLPTGNLLIDEIRARAQLDGFSMGALDRECGTGTYWRKGCKRDMSMPAVAKALKLLGGRLSVKWDDEATSPIAHPDDAETCAAPAAHDRRQGLPATSPRSAD